MILAIRRNSGNPCGLIKADAEALEKLPAIWRNEPAQWLTLKLRDDIDAILSAEKEFAVFMESEKERTKKAFQQAKALKMLATLIAVVLLGLVIIGAFLVIRRNPNFLHR